VLKLIADTLRRQVKGQGFVARYGGEEFAVILSDVDLQKAISTAELLRRSVASNELEKRSTGAKLGHLTISIGVATAQPGESGQALIEAADFCLYQAKTAGRNRVFSEVDIGQPGGNPIAGPRKSERRAGVSASA
jgi:diguanylate cyclase